MLRLPTSRAWLCYGGTNATISCSYTRSTHRYDSSVKRRSRCHATNSPILTLLLLVLHHVTTLELGWVLEGHGCPRCWGWCGRAYCLWCVFFSSIASYWAKCISSPPWAGCAFRIYNWLHAQSLACLGLNTLAIDTSADNISIMTRHTVTDLGLATLSFHHAWAETLML